MRKKAIFIMVNFGACTLRMGPSKEINVIKKFDCSKNLFGPRWGPLVLFFICNFLNRGQMLMNIKKLFQRHWGRFAHSMRYLRWAQVFYKILNNLFGYNKHAALNTRFISIC